MEKETEKSSWVKREEKVLRFWKEKNIFARTLEKPAPRGEFVFYEGPPTANGRPGIHHLEARAFKDLVPRYKTMRGYRVWRKAGWDTHGLPVEIGVERELKLKSKKEVEAHGVAAFNRKCRESVWRYLEEWRRFTERIGFWLDHENPYITYTPRYIESLWYIVKKIDERGLLYRDYKVLPWCPRCGTALSSHELAQGYAEVEDPAVFVKLKVKNPKKVGLRGEVYLLAWTTTPWTLPANVALAVGPEIDYVAVIGREGLLIKARDAEIRKGDLQQPRWAIFHNGTESVKGKDLVGLEYEPLYTFLGQYNPAGIDRAHKVYPADFVTTNEGTGIVHTAVMYGQDDFELGTKFDLPKEHLVDETGHFTSQAGFLAGRFVKDKSTESAIIKDLDDRRLLFGQEKYKHSYPHCWRCRTPLIYYARDSWYVRMSVLREELLRENEKIAWVPEHLKEGRFGEWLREVKDWAISRERYWGTPLPVWTPADKPFSKERIVVDSMAALKRYTKKSGNHYFVMRHGEAENNVRQILSSRPENLHHLTEKGRADVLTAVERLKREKIDRVFASDFLRTKETAELVIEGLGLSAERLVLDQRLREVNHGDLNLRPVEEYHAYYVSPRERFTKALPGGENFAEIKRRLGEFLYETEKYHRGENILIITHESPSWLLFAAAAGADVDQTLTLRSDAEFMKTAEIRPLGFTPLPHNEDFELDLHLPYIDELELVDEDGRPLRRTPEVMDVWFDSGAMPFAQGHYPFETDDRRLLYPADFIAEAIDQTRGWFYTLLAVGVLVGRGAPYRRAISLGHILDKEGKKMSKSLGNIVDPWLMMDKYGADTLRFWMYAVNQPGEAKNFDEATVQEVFQRVFNPLLNVVTFLDLYVRDETTPSSPPSGDNPLDRWLLVRLNALIREITVCLDQYRITEAARHLRDFIADLSQWYLRRSRDRFRAAPLPERRQAASVCRWTLRRLAILLAPFTPFLAEDLFQRFRLATDPESVHLLDWPEAGPVEEEILSAMVEIRKAISRGLEWRMRAGLPVRQPLARVTLGAAFSRLRDFYYLLREELNVREVVLDEGQKDFLTLDTTLTPELREEGELRELTRKLQDWRKKNRLTPGETAAIPVSRRYRPLVQKFEERLKSAVAASGFVFID